MSLVLMMCAFMFPYWGFHKWGYPHSWMVSKGKIIYKPQLVNHQLTYPLVNVYTLPKNINLFSLVNQCQSVKYHIYVKYILEDIFTFSSIHYMFFID